MCASRRHDVPVARVGLSMSTLLTNITEGQELPEEIKKQFEVWVSENTLAMATSVLPVALILANNLGGLFLFVIFGWTGML